MTLTSQGAGIFIESGRKMEMGDRGYLVAHQLKLPLAPLQWGLCATLGVSTQNEERIRVKQ